jgi:transcriptional regulator with XRE-family HTH domain
MVRERFMKGIGKRLREIRGDRTQESVCKALSEILGEERTKEAYQHYEAGRRLVPADVLWGLSQIYGVSTDWILSGEKPLRGKAAKKPDVLIKLNKDVMTLAKLINSLSKEQKDAVKVVLKAMGIQGNKNAFNKRH